jgi:hypothetical protein
MSITANYPNLRPSLLLDFANSQQLDPRVTFSRSTTAPYYDGKTSALAEQNLLIQSNTFSNAAWVATSATIASGVTDPAGGTTAFSMTATAGNATLYQTLTLTATAYTESIWIQRVTGTGTINLTIDGATLSPVTITGSWAKYTYTATPTAGAKTIGIQIVTSGDAINIYGSQIENRSSATATNITTTSALTNYIPQLLTAPINQPRFDFNPTTGESLGLLIEQSSTNTWLNSSTFGGWITNGAVTLLAQNIFIDGTQTLNILGQGTGNNRLYQFDNSGTLGSKTFSFYAKQYTGQTVAFAAVGGTSATGTVTFNLNTGTASGGTNYTTSMTLVGNGVYRCSLTISVSVASGNSTYFVITVPTNQIFIGGFQYEALAFPTSYIPTTSAQVTRASDNASMTGTNFSSWYTQGQGTVYAEYNSSKNSNNSYGVFVISDNSPTNRYIIANNISGTRSEFYEINTSSSSITLAATTTASSFNKTAVSFVGTTISGSYNGSFVTGTSTTMSATMTVLGLGYFYPGSPDTNFLNGHIKKLSYYGSALTSAQLQALTGS